MACRVLPAATVSLSPAPLRPEQVRAGSPQVSATELLTSPIEIGVWQHTVGTSSDTEADELFVVLSGRASIAVTGGPTLQVGPGDVAVLESGAQTVWTVHETLRKVYVLLPAGP
jgi:uncharacterized protein